MSPVLRPERRDDGWYLDDQRIEVGDFIMIAFPDPDPSAELVWSCLRVTADILDREVDPDPNAFMTLSLDMLVHLGGIASWCADE